MLTNRDYEYYVICLVAFGCFLIALSVFGCVVVCRKNVCLITMVRKAETDQQIWNWYSFCSTDSLCWVLYLFRYSSDIWKRIWRSKVSKRMKSMWPGNWNIQDHQMRGIWITYRWKWVKNTHLFIITNSSKF